MKAGRYGALWTMGEIMGGESSKETMVSWGEDGGESLFMACEEGGEWKWR